MEEEYKTIRDYDNYVVSNFGNVKNTKTNKFLKPQVDMHGYYTVDLYNNNKRKHKKIHRLVIEAFIENIFNKPCVDHINNDRLNNNVKNLRYATSQENKRNSKLNINNTSSVKGVHFNKKAQKYSAQIVIDGIKIHIGYFQNIEDAKQARISKAHQVFGVYKNNCEN